MDDVDPMTREPGLDDARAWLVAAGLGGDDEQAIVAGLGDRLRRAGLALSRINVTIDTLHPVHEGHVYRWKRDIDAVPLPYGRDYDDDTWLGSPLYRLSESGGRSLRRRMGPDTEGEFAVFAEYRAAGITDYLLLVDRFGPTGTLGEMDCVYSSWMTDAPAGFADAEVAALEALSPLLALAVKTAALTGIARTLVGTYLGGNAGSRVLSGRIARGVADRIDAVLWYSDLRGYTAIADAAAPDQVIPFLNAYADPVVSAIHAHGGDVIKFMGDGLLALFGADDTARGCELALRAAEQARRGVAEMTERRRGEGLLNTDLYLALHTGSVFFGNIGTDDRLDFTVVGPAVNEVSRIAAMCRSVDRPLLMSSAFVAAVDPGRRRVASVGRYALRGVGRAQELFTLADGA